MTITAAKTNGRGRDYMPLRFKRVRTFGMSQPCIVPVSHKPDNKGYVRLVPRDGTGDRARPLHRTVFLSRNGPDAIPEGYEIDHICGRRSCCNPSHLRLLSVSDHKRLTAAYRYADRKEAVWADWTYYRSSPAELAERHGFKAKTIAQWIPGWKRDALGAAT